MMIVELIMYLMVASFIALVILGHVLLASAIVQCVREDRTGGRRRARPARVPTIGLRPFKALVTHYVRAADALSAWRAPRVGWRLPNVEPCQCRRFEAPTALAANPFRNFGSGALARSVDGRQFTLMPAAFTNSVLVSIS